MIRWTKKRFHPITKEPNDLKINVPWKTKNNK